MKLHPLATATLIAMTAIIGINLWAIGKARARSTCYAHSRSLALCTPPGWFEQFVEGLAMKLWGKREGGGMW